MPPSRKKNLTAMEKYLTEPNPDDILNRCRDDNCTDINASPDEQRAYKAMRWVADMRGRQVQPLPDIMFVHVAAGDDRQDRYHRVAEKTDTKFAW